MQRIRETGQGLQCTQGMDVVTFSPDDKGDVAIYNRESVLSEKGSSRKFTIDGRDNIRDFGEWLTKLSPIDTESPSPSSFNNHAVDKYTWVAAASAAQPNRGVSLAEALESGSDDIGTDLIEDLNSVINTISDITGQLPRNLTRIENEAFAYPLGIPENMRPVVLATQTHNQLQLQFDELFIYNSIPFESARQLGDWSLRGLVEIERKSVWG